MKVFVVELGDSEEQNSFLSLLPTQNLPHGSFSQDLSVMLQEGIDVLEFYIYEELPPFPLYGYLRTAVS
jgi:hypothetical protein